MRQTPYPALAVTLLLWASSFAAIKSGLQGYSPLELAALRFAAAALLLGCIAPLIGIRIPRRADAIPILALGLIGVAAYHILLNLGESLSSAGAAAFITNIAPVFAAILARLSGERTRPRAWAGLVTSLLGAWLISPSSHEELRFDLGCLLLVLAALCWSLFFVLQKPLLARYSPLEVTCYAVWIGTLLLAIFLPNAVIATRNADVIATVSAFYLGIFPSAAGYLLWSQVLAKMPVSSAAIYTYLVPVIATGIAYLWLGERPTLWFVLGAAGVLLGVFLAHRSHAALQSSATAVG